ncbi:MFS transporter [Streptosporangiaceae bacterium NEAU-GS5]|nr:MFS transporter [Streptosporangiaceae bacterium NEAU-GS5]
MPATLTKTQYRIAVLVCLFTIILAILDQNVVSAALVRIASDLDPVHGLDQMPWVVTAFSLGATVAVPLYGRLCDLYGPRRVFISVVAVFVGSSMLCGLSQSILQLVLFRALQGLGAGGLISVTMIAAAYLAMVRPGGRKPGAGAGPSGLAGVVFGVGLTVGPPVGGFFADHGIWRWIFYVNLPLGVLILIGALAVFRFPRKPAAGSIDFWGAALAGTFAGCVLLVADWGGQEYAWTSPVIIALAVAGAVTLALFLWRQVTAESPIMPLSLFRIRSVRSSYLIQTLQGIALVGVVIYMLMYLQVARNVSATSTGLFLVFLAAGITATGLAGPRLGLSLRTAMVAGTATATVALASFAFIGPATSLWLIRGELTLLGLGFGLLLGRLITLVQDTAPPQQLGVALAGLRFYQVLGGAIGAAAFGSVLRRLFARDEPGVELTAVKTLTGSARDSAVSAFTSSVGVVFAIAAGFMALAVVFASRLRDVDAPPGEEAAVPRSPEQAGRPA